MLNHELKIKEIRKTKGISQAKLAKELNTTQQLISKYEKHIDLPSVTRLVDIATILGVTLDELVEVKCIHAEYSKALSDTKKDNHMRGFHEIYQYT